MNFKETNWCGFRRLDFELDGHNGIAVYPEASVGVSGVKWVWRTEFFGEYDNADRMMLDRGYMLFHYSISDMYGCPQAVELMKKFYDFVREQFHLDRKTVLIGLSRGGLYAANFAIKYPEKVAAMYLDAPVLDIKSWPRKAYENTALWEECKRWYGITEDNYEQFHDSPIDHIDVLIGNDIPVFVISGDMDTSVRFEENSKILIERYKQAGKRIGCIIKPGGKHHPHSLKDPSPICDFLCECYPLKK